MRIRTSLKQPTADEQYFYLTRNVTRHFRDVYINYFFNGVLEHSLEKILDRCLPQLEPVNEDFNPQDKKLLANLLKHVEATE